MPQFEDEPVDVTLRFTWKFVGEVTRANGKTDIPSRDQLDRPGTYRLHAGGWPKQADEWEECWYVGMSGTSMLNRLVRHLGEAGVPHLPGKKPFKWILDNGGWVGLWIAQDLSYNNVESASIDRALIGRGEEAPAILSTMGYMGRWNVQL